jgi:hypothetical protein
MLHSCFLTLGDHARATLHSTQRILVQRKGETARSIGAGHDYRSIGSLFLHGICRLISILVFNFAIVGTAAAADDWTTCTIGPLSDQVLSESRSPIGCQGSGSDQGREKGSRQRSCDHRSASVHSPSTPR